MKIQIFQINVNDGRRKVDPDAVQEMADSISKVGLLNPITVDQDYTLIAGLHRLEAAKLLGWTEIECTVSGLEGLEAELAEIDENFVRKDLSDAEFRELLLRRKVIYENLHPETKVGVAQAVAMNRTIGNNVTAPSAVTLKPFVDDTAEKIGKAPRTIREELQIAKHLVPEAQDVIQSSNTKIKKKDTIKISRLPPEQQEDAARQLVSKAIKSVDDYHPAPALPKDVEEQEPEPEAPPDTGQTAPPPEVPVPPPSEGGYYATTRDSVKDLKDPDKDRRRTPDTLITSLSFFLQRFCQNVMTYAGAEYDTAFPMLTQDQLNQIHQEICSVQTVLNDLYNKIERMAQNE